ncbi:MAG: DUF2062 domain-containing protein [Planctomycetaceae bacterium]
MSITPRGGWWKSPRMLLRTILQLDDTPHSIALGTAVGMWIGMTPTVGIQMGLVMLFVFLTRPLFRFNVMAAIVTVYISNPITMIPIYWFNYKVGTLFIEGIVSKEQFHGVMKSDEIRDSWTAVLTLFADLGWPLVVGSLIVATICSVITYPSMLALIYWFRRMDAEAMQKLATSTTESSSPETADVKPAADVPGETEAARDTGRDETLACVAGGRTTTVESIVI